MCQLAALSQIYISFQVLSLSPGSWEICTLFDSLAFLEPTLIQYFLNFYRQQQSAAGSVWLIILQAGNNKGCTTLKHDEDGLFQTSIPTERESSVKVQYTITSDYSS